MTYNIDRGCFENCFDFLLGPQKEEGIIQTNKDKVLIYLLKEVLR